MAWTVTASVIAVAGKEKQVSRAADEAPDAASGGRVRLTVEMAAAFVGTVDIATDMDVQDVRVEVHLSGGGEAGAEGAD